MSLSLPGFSEEEQGSEGSHAAGKWQSVLHTSLMDVKVRAILRMFWGLGERAEAFLACPAPGHTLPEEEHPL